MFFFGDGRVLRKTLKVLVCVCNSLPFIVGKKASMTNLQSRGREVQTTHSGAIAMSWMKT